MTKTAFHTRNVLIMMGLVVTTVGLIYFATEFSQRLSEWGGLASVILLAVVFVSLGRHFETGPETMLVEQKGLRWLRVTTALYVLALVAALTAVLVFLSMDGVDRLIKVGVTVLVGLGLILGAAQRFGEP